VPLTGAATSANTEASRLLPAAAPQFTVDGDAGARKVSAGAEATIVLRSAVTLSPDTENSCQGMRFETRWTVSGQSGQHRRRLRAARPCR
jgi:hypothetical protein